MQPYSNIWGMLWKLHVSNSKGWVSQGQAEHGEGARVCTVCGGAHPKGGHCLALPL